MKQMLTTKLKLHTTPSQFRALRQTQLAYRDALNAVSRYAFAHGKKSNQQWLQQETYAQVRATYHLPAQMACNVPRQVGATYKTLWTKLKQNNAARKAGITKKRYKGLDQPPRYVSPTLTYNYHRDYSLKPQQQVSLLTLDGRVVVCYTGYEKHLALLQHGAHLGAAKLWYDKSRKQFYLLVTLELEVADPTPETHQHVVGVDVGQHTISRRIVDQHPHSIIGLEDLTHIRQRTKRRHGKKATKKQHRANRHVSKWAFAELHGYLAYKAMLAGSMAVRVDAHYSSQACPRCGHTGQDNRPNKGLMFVCQSCHYRLHADLIGARNVALRTLLVRQDWMSTGVLSARPDVSSAEAKAARLRRYAELRWSPDNIQRQSRRRCRLCYSSWPRLISLWAFLPIRPVSLLPESFKFLEIIPMLYEDRGTYTSIIE